MSMQIEPCRDLEQRRPGHPDEPDAPEGTVTEPAWERIKAWHLHAPAERLPVTFTAACWPACWAAHQARMPAGAPAVAAALAAAGAAVYWGYHQRARAKARRDGRKEPHPRMKAAEAAAVAAVIGLWVTLAVTWGPLAGPAHLLTWLYVAGAVTGYRWLRNHHAVRAARKRRDDLAAELADKKLWHEILPRIGLNGWHLQERWDTNLGEERLLTTSPDNTTARSIAASSDTITEKLEHILGLPYNRIDIRTTDLPGQLIIGIRTVDMSAREAAYHPMTLPWPDSQPSPFADLFPPVASIRDPLTWGFRPEDGSPLSIRPYTSQGGWVVGVFGDTGSGKSNLLNGIREFITRCPDARMVQLNGAHSVDEKTWEPLSALTICGPVRTDEGVANNIAEVLEALCLLVTNRSSGLAESGNSVFQPTAAHPAVGIIIDEVDAIIASVPGAREALEFLASKQRKSAVFLIPAAQRAVVSDIGAKVRVNMHESLVGRVARDGESRHATGKMDIPDIREYSRGEPGYFQCFDVNAGQVTGRGRAFLLGVHPEEPAYCARLVAARRHLRDWSIPDMPPLVLDGGKGAAEEAAAKNAGEASGLRARVDALASATRPETPPATRSATPAQAPRGTGPATPGETFRAIPASVPPEIMRALMPLLQDGQVVSSAKLALAAKLSKPTAWRHLAALAEADIVEKAGAGKHSGFRLVLRPAPGPEPGPYVTLAALAEAAHNGEIECDDDQREVLARVYEIYHRPAAGGDAP